MDDLNDLFNNLVDFSEEIYQKIKPFLSSILITDTTGIESYVAENNPKFYQSQLKKSKSHAKFFASTNPNSDVEKYAQLYKKNIIPIININPRNSQGLPEPRFSEFGIPLCPNDPSLPMTYDGICRKKGLLIKLKIYALSQKRLILMANFNMNLVAKIIAPLQNVEGLRTLPLIIITD